MQIERVRELTESCLGDVSPQNLSYDVIEKGGSGRMFVRVRDTISDHSWVAMAYSDDRPDNARFASVTDFLIDHNVAVPAIIGRLESEGFLLVEDLGNVDLGDLAGRPWETEQKPGYEAALQTVFALHQIFESSQPEHLPELEFCFDAELYQWEQDYFFNHYVANFESAAAQVLRTAPELANLRDWLSAQPRSLVHRDFQSTNVMLLSNRCYLIDYQGMRFGLPEYDLASMVYDPYVDLLPKQRDELIEFYFQLKQRAGHKETFEAYLTRLNACAVQRLMQALGAYGYLGLTKDKTEFLQHIAPAKARLIHAASSACPKLVDLIG